MITYKDLLMLKLSQTTQWKSKDEMYIPKSMMANQFGSIFTCEFVDLTDRTYILRGYYKSGAKHWQYEYQNGQQHGQSVWWYENGAKHWQADFQNGQRHGKSIGWYESGAKSWQDEYQNGKLIKEIK